MTNNQEQNTNDRILAAAIQLMDKKGFKAVTVKDIALSAGTSEMTIFRNFGTKNEVLESAIKKYSYAIPMKSLFEERIVWDLKTDLFMIARTYHQLMSKNKSVILIALEERNTMPHFLELILQNPRELKECLLSYLETMQKLGKIHDANLEIQATAFIHMNFGTFIANVIHRSDSVEDSYLKEVVDTFARGLAM